MAYLGDWVMWMLENIGGWTYTTYHHDLNFVEWRFGELVDCRPTLKVCEFRYDDIARKAESLALDIASYGFAVVYGRNGDSHRVYGVGYNDTRDVNWQGLYELLR